MTELEKQQLKVKLSEAIDLYLDTVTAQDNNIGYIPDNTSTLMAEAAFCVLMCATETNEYFDSQGMIKK